MIKVFKDDCFMLLSFLFLLITMIICIAVDFSSLNKELTNKCTYSEESFNNGYSNILAIESYQSEK